MRPEVPVVTRCCFCLPLRYGLIGWGYIKLALSTYLTTMLAIEWGHIFSFGGLFGPPVFIALYVIATLVVLVDYILTLLFIIGCHQKNTRLINIFYYYSQVILILIVLLGACSVYVTIERLIRLESNGSQVHKIVDLCVFFIIIGVQFYILLLIRSEIIKLNNGCPARLENHNTSEPDCTLDVEPPIRQYEKVALV